MLTCIFQFLDGGYPGTWEHSFIHSFIHSSSYTTHLYGRPRWNPCPRHIPRYYHAGGRRKKRSCCAPVVQIAHTVPGPWGPMVTQGFPSHSSSRRQESKVPGIGRVREGKIRGTSTMRWVVPQQMQQVPGRCARKPGKVTLLYKGTPACRRRVPGLNNFPFDCRATAG